MRSWKCCFARKWVVVVAVAAAGNHLPQTKSSRNQRKHYLTAGCRSFERRWKCFAMIVVVVDNHLRFQTNQRNPLAVVVGCCCKNLLEHNYLSNQMNDLLPHAQTHHWTCHTSHRPQVVVADDTQSSSLSWMHYHEV